MLVVAAATTAVAVVASVPTRRSATLVQSSKAGDRLTKKAPITLGQCKNPSARNVVTINETAPRASAQDSWLWRRLHAVCRAMNLHRGHVFMYVRSGGAFRDGLECAMRDAAERVAAERERICMQKELSL